MLSGISAIVPGDRAISTMLAVDILLPRAFLETGAQSCMIVTEGPKGYLGWLSWWRAAAAAPAPAPAPAARPSPMCPCCPLWGTPAQTACHVGHRQPLPGQANSRIRSSQKGAACDGVPCYQKGDRPQHQVQDAQECCQPWFIDSAMLPGFVPEGGPGTRSREAGCDCSSR